MKKANKTPIFFSGTAWVVWLSIILSAITMALQYFSPGVSLPHETIAWGLVAVAGGYTGVDRLSYFVKSKTLEYGESDHGNVHKMKWVICLLFVLIIEALVLQVIFKVKDLPLETLVISFSSTASIYAIGNKAIAAAGYTVTVPKVPTEESQK